MPVLSKVQRSDSGIICLWAVCDTPLCDSQAIKEKPAIAPLGTRPRDRRLGCSLGTRYTDFACFGRPVGTDCSNGNKCGVVTLSGIELGLDLRADLLSLLTSRNYGENFEQKLPKKRKKKNKKNSGTGNRTPSCRVKDGDVCHYTMPEEVTC